MGVLAKSYNADGGGAIVQPVALPCRARILVAISRLLCFSNTISDGVSILGAFEVASL